MFVESNHDTVNFSVVFNLKFLFLYVTLSYNLNYFVDSRRYLALCIVRAEPVIFDKLLVKQVLSMA